MNVILPIGSVVKIKDVNIPVMIFGILQKSGSRPDEIVDYVGVPYPMGNVNVLAQIGFMMTDITEVLFEGYRDESFRPLETILLIHQAAHKLEAEGKL